MLLEGNSNDIVQTMRRSDSGAAVVDATLTCKVYDPAGTLIDTVNMTLYDSSTGEYRGTTSVTYGVGVKYTFDIKASNYTFRRIKRETCTGRGIKSAG